MSEPLDQPGPDALWLPWMMWLGPSPDDFERVFIRRWNWESAKLVEPRKLDPGFNVHDLYWTPFVRKP